MLISSCQQRNLNLKKDGKYQQAGHDLCLFKKKKLLSWRMKTLFKVCFFHPYTPYATFSKFTAEALMSKNILSHHKLTRQSQLYIALQSSNIQCHFHQRFLKCSIHQTVWKRILAEPRKKWLKGLYLVLNFQAKMLAHCDVCVLPTWYMSSVLVISGLEFSELTTEMPPRGEV